MNNKDLENNLVPVGLDEDEKSCNKGNEDQGDALTLTPPSPSKGQEKSLIPLGLDEDENGCQRNNNDPGDALTATPTSPSTSNHSRCSSKEGRHSASSRSSAGAFSIAPPPSLQNVVSGSTISSASHHDDSVGGNDEGSNNDDGLGDNNNDGVGSNDDNNEMTHYVTEATRVDDFVTTDAKPISPALLFASTKIGKISLALALVILLALTISFSLVFSNGGGGNGQEKKVVLSLEERERVATELWQNVSLLVLNDQNETELSPSSPAVGTPQYQAIEWMTHVDKVEPLTAQRYALAVMYFSTGGVDGWLQQKEFLTATEHECNWNGALLCEAAASDDNDQKQVTGLLMPANNLTGSIPIELFTGLPRLEQIVLDENAFTGTLPTILSGATSELSSTKKTNPHMRQLRISNNLLTGAIHRSVLEYHPNLESLDLSLNEISGTIPSEVGKLSNLTSLQLYSNVFTGLVPQSLWALTKLQVIILYQDKRLALPTIPPAIANMTDLTHFSVARMNNTGTIPSELGLLTKLTTLELGANSFTSTLPEALGQLTNLVRLTVSHNSITGTVPTSILQWSNLNQLYLHNTKLSGSLEFMCDAQAAGVIGPLQDFRADKGEVACSCCTCCDT